jgi:hypothetical protein
LLAILKACVAPTGLKNNWKNNKRGAFTQGSRLRRAPSAATARQARPGLSFAARTRLVIEWRAISAWRGGALGRGADGFCGGVERFGPFDGGACYILPAGFGD